MRMAEPASPEAQVKIQECFQLKEHPHICEGKLPVKLWLCTPDGKRLEATLTTGRRFRCCDVSEIEGPASEEILIVALALKATDYSSRFFREQVVCGKTRFHGLEVLDLLGAMLTLAQTPGLQHLSTLQKRDCRFFPAHSAGPGCW